MKKVTITLAFEDEKLDALEFSLKKENASVQESMDDVASLCCRALCVLAISSSLNTSTRWREKAICVLLLLPTLVLAALPNILR